MIDVNWELAPEGAIGVAQRGQQLAFVDNDRNIFLDGHWGVSMGWELVAKRPTKKTVADAVEYYGKTFVAGQWTHMRCGKDGKMFFASGETDSDNWQDSYLVCTRADFEAYVNASKIGKILESSDEKEGEKWTHTYGEHKCCIKLDEPDLEGYIVVVTEFNGYIPCKPENLKPIKPTISESEMMQRIKYRAISIDDDDEFGSKVRAWLDEYNIT